MEFFLIAIPSAFWFGILTSISPCPLATNITAISFLGKEMGEPKQVFWAGLQYTVGRAVAYFSISSIVSLSLLSIPDVAQFLQKNMNQIIGPLMVIAGVMLLGIIPLPARYFGLRFLEKLQEIAKKNRGWGAAILGFSFALAFCPISAGLFFGGLIPIAVKYHSYFLIPFLFGLGTAIPVVVFAVIIAMGGRRLGQTFNKLSAFEIWARKITGILFILMGSFVIAQYLI